MKKILVIEDEAAINDLICMNLEIAGYCPVPFFDGIKVSRHLERDSKYDLALLDIMLPGKDGFALLKELKSHEIPVIYLTAKGDLSSKVKGLKSGAEDYLVKPFEMLELIARVNLVLTKTQKAVSRICIADTKVDLKARKVSVCGKETELAKQEFDLLEALILNRNIALSREKLLELAWGYDFMGDTRTVDVHITKLRKKLKLENHIKTVYKMGYRLEL